MEALLNLETGKVESHWRERCPGSIVVDQKLVFPGEKRPSILDGLNRAIVPVTVNNVPLTDVQEDGGYEFTVDGLAVEATKVVRRISDDVLQRMIVEERDHRLAAGFDHDFGDARGVHRFGTTPADLDGWAEVRALASARVAAGDTTLITVATDTGVTQIAASEWALIDLAAAGFRQPIWATSFSIAANPPDDFRNDVHWP